MRNAKNTKADIIRIHLFKLQNGQINLVLKIRIGAILGEYIRAQGGASSSGG